MNIKVIFKKVKCLSPVTQIVYLMLLTNTAGKYIQINNNKLLSTKNDSGTLENHFCSRSV